MATEGELRSLQIRATELEQEIPYAENKNAALQLALDAAELCMKGLKIAKSSSEKSAMTKKCRVFLDEAERIKTSSNWPPVSLDDQEEDLRAFSPQNVKRFKEPSSSRGLSKREQILLLQNSKLNGFVFPPWKGPPDHVQFDLRADEEKFLDLPELSLSKSQLPIFHGWERPENALPPPALFTGRMDRPGPTMGKTRAVDLVQDAVTDCSVVASLCAVTARAEKGHTKLLASICFPYDHANQRPLMSPNGKYVIRLNVNGCYRQVVIDDRLPVSRTSQILHVIDRRNPSLLWPALIEKAFLKVRGGYDFPGSNSGTDLWILTGWIPEQIFLQSDELVSSQLWSRVRRAFGFGDVLITLGTGQMTSQAEKLLGLAGLHDYAVLDLQEEDGWKRMLIKNPWCQGSSWEDTMKWPDASTASSWHGISEVEECFALSPRGSASTESPTPGTFWMDFGNIMQHFESIYLNWNPGLFSHRQDVHFAWDLSLEGDTSGRAPPGSFASNPQHSISVTENSELWLLLCRHFRTDEDKANRSPHMSSSLELKPGFISLYAFDRGGQRIYLSEGAVEQGSYVDSPQTLLKLNLRANTPYTIVASEQDLPSVCHTFTLSAFSTSNIQICEASAPYSETTSVRGAWTSSTAGGNSSAPTYSQNPQFSLTVPQPTPMTILLQGADGILNLHVKLLHGGGKRIHTVARRDIVVDSGDYRRGCALAESPNIEPGIYTLICSTFEAGQLSAFTLRVDSNVPCQLRPIPKDGAGRIRMQLASVSFPPGQNRLVAALTPRALSRLYLSAVPVPIGLPHRRTLDLPSPLRISISLGLGPDRKILVSSSDGAFTDSVKGLRTEDVDLSPELLRQHQLWLIVDRFAGFVADAGRAESVAVEMWSDRPHAVEVGAFTAWNE